MLCMSCGTDIPASFKLAISQGVCPACGENLYTEDIKELMTELASALERMPNDPQGLAGWLLSNYRVKKIGSAEPVSEFYGKKPNSAKQSTDESGLRMAHSPVQEFMNRAGAKPKSADELAEVYRKIAASREGDEVEPIQQDYPDNDPEEQAIAATMHQPITRKQMQNYTQRQVSSEFDHADDRHPAIQQERIERLRKQNELAGGGVGSITRRS